jgi:YVTN family beta-propeller protein
MNQTRRETVSRWLGGRLAPAIPALSLAIASALPSGSIVAQNPANVVLNNIPTGLVVEGLTVSPNSQFVYVAGFSRVRGSPSHLFIINAQLPTIAADIRLKGESKAVDVAISRDGRKAYVTNFNSKSVSVVSTATQTVIGTLGVGPSPVGVAVSPNGKELWVANSGAAPSFNNGTVSVFSTATLEPIALINVGGSPTQVVFETVGNLAFVLNQLGTGFVSVVDRATHNIINGSFGSGIINNPFALGEAILPSATSLYVNNGLATINDLLIMTGTLKDLVTVFPSTVPPSSQQLGQSIVTPDGNFLYVANPDLNQVSWVTTENDLAQQLSPISVSPGVGPVTLAVSPDDTRLYVGNAGNGLVTQIDITH